jgi:hypothetical protein
MCISSHLYHLQVTLQQTGSLSFLCGNIVPFYRLLRISLYMYMKYRATMPPSLATIIPQLWVTTCMDDQSRSTTSSNRMGCICTEAARHKAKFYNKNDLSSSCTAPC